ncbi:MAG: Ig-like domain-containing protein, partial [Bacteroidales bacterium]|nr:Ig-like domain-containing protein [Bacteroidales bacterium]
NISDGTTREVAVTWSNYSTDTAGTYTLSGEYNMPAGITGTKPSVSITLKVIAPLTIVGYVMRPPNFTVNEGYSLAQWMSDYDFIDFYLSDGTRRKISVTWATDYTANSPADIYYINAVYTLPSDIVGDIYPVIVTLTVLEAEYIDIVPYLIDQGFSTGTDGNGSYVLVTGPNLDLMPAVGSFLGTKTAEYKLFIKGVSVGPSVGLNYRLTDLTNNTINFPFSLIIEAVVVNTGNVHLDQLTLLTMGSKQVKIYGLEISKTSNPPSWYV